MARPTLLFVFLAMLCSNLGATVALPKIFSDNMVLQRGKPIPLWGKARAGEHITVRLHGQTASVIADDRGHWSLKLRAEKAGGPYILVVSGENTITINNVLVGEVWLCSGQSNMEWTVGQSLQAEQELKDAENPNIRHIKIAKTLHGLPQDDLQEGKWNICNATNAKDFSGVAYFFAKNIYKELQVPIGLINASWGGTNVETWISRVGFEQSDEFSALISGIPVLDLDSLRARAIAGKLAHIEAMQQCKLGSLDMESFKSPGFDGEKLPTIYQPMAWEKQSLGEMDGIVWFRATIKLTKAQCQKEAILHLTKIDDEDITYINAVEVGKTSKWDEHRKYKIPVGILKEGVNAIAIRVVDTGGGGGIWGEADDFKLQIGDESISLAGNWQFQVERIFSDIHPNSFPCLTYNAMIHPLIPFGIRGVLWYQGESNADRAFQYRTAFPLLIEDWRRHWEMDKMPFFFVQLATFKTQGNSNQGCSWAELREAQTMTLQVPKTGMVVTTDVGNPKDIHPTNKQVVGKRLAALALNRVYNKKRVDSGPMFKSLKINENMAVLSFKHVGGGLVTSDTAGELGGFEVAGVDGKFYAAHATVKGKKVVVDCTLVPAPVAVRFGWLGDASANNLFNKEGFPASPFRTDDWNTVTKASKYMTSLK